jgi:hypothetical protein
MTMTKGERNIVRRAGEIIRKYAVDNDAYSMATESIESALQFDGEQSERERYEDLQIGSFSRRQRLPPIPVVATVGFLAGYSAANNAWARPR